MAITAWLNMKEPFKVSKIEYINSAQPEARSMIRAISKL